MVLRMLDTTGMAEVVRLEHPDPSLHRLGAEQSIEIADAPEPYLPPSQIARITAIPADADVVDGALRLVVALARVTVGGADGVSVSLRRHGRLATVAASDQTISDMDASQYATGEGPCVDASVKGRWFHAESLDIETRWPAFTPRAAGSRDKRHSVFAPTGRGETGRGPQHLLPHRDGLRSEGSGAGGGVRRRGLARPHQRRGGCDR